MEQSFSEKAAWYLLSYSGTLSFESWKSAVEKLIVELEKEYGRKEAIKMVNRSVVYFCMEIGNSYKGRIAISKFRKIHLWPDARNSKEWWKEEWQSRIEFDKRVQEVRHKVLQLLSIPFEKVHHDPNGREALSLLETEAIRRHGEFVTEETMNVFRNIISIYGGHSIIALYRSGGLSNRMRIPSMLSSYFIERELVAEYGEALATMKKKEYS